MSAREAIALSQGTWSGASTTGQNQKAAQTLYGMQSQPARWRKNRRGGRRGMGNGTMHGGPRQWNGNGNGNVSRKNRKANRKGTRRNRH
jgi:hypothetical protein